MHPLQYDLRSSAAQDNSITHAAAAPSNLDAMVSEIAAPKPDLDAKAEKNDFEALFKRIFKKKIASAKIAKICWQITIAAWMQPL